MSVDARPVADARGDGPEGAPGGRPVGGPEGPWHRERDGAPDGEHASCEDGELAGGTALTVYFDGSCPLCRAEIGHYAAEPGASRLCFRDVSLAEVAPGPDLTAAEAMARFHVRRADGSLLSGAAAFVAIWRILPRWRWAARAAAFPGVMSILEGGYRLFLPVRPRLARLVGALMRMRKRRQRGAGIPERRR